MKQRAASKQYMGSESDTMTYAAGGSRRGSEVLWNLSDTVDLLSSSDGAKPRIISIKITVHASGTVQFGLLPIVLQTAGAWTDSVDQALQKVEEVLAVDVDDVFGYQPTKREWQIARFVPFADPQFISRFSVDIPQNIIALLNKEAETEKLQSLYAGHVVTSTANDVYSVTSHIEIRYTETRKSIVMR